MELVLYHIVKHVKKIYAYTSCESDIIHSNNKIILFKQRELKQNIINQIIKDMEELNNKILQFKLEISKLETLFGEIFK